MNVAMTRRDDGYAMAALLVGMVIMAVFLSMALPAWKTQAQREKEDELVFRGQQYARAIVLFQRKYANTFPPNLDVLLNEHFLRRKYKDPMTAAGEFQLIYANQQQGTAQPSAGGAAGGIVPTQGQQVRPPSQQVGGGAPVGPQGGIIGVASKSTAESIRIYNGHDHYNEWVFVAQQASARAGAPNGTQTPTGGINLPGGAPGQRGGRGGPQPPGGGFPGRGQPPPNGRGQQPPGQRGFGGQQPGGFGAPGGGFGAPIGPGGLQLPGRGR
jgi:type II secretory pathway pseudopilin PulG